MTLQILFLSLFDACLGLDSFPSRPDYGTVLVGMSDPDQPGKKDVIHFNRLWDPPEVAQEPGLSTVYVDINRRLVLRPDDTVYLEDYQSQHPLSAEDKAYKHICVPISAGAMQLEHTLYTLVMTSLTVRDSKNKITPNPVEKD